MSNIGTHQSHCCAKHDCKYGDDDCPVFSGDVIQDFACPFCLSTSYLDKEIARLQDERAWSQKLEERGLTVSGDEESGW